MAQSSLKMAADDQIDLMALNSPMKISDAASMYRRRIRPNEPPYDAEIKKLNNQSIDEWYERLLVKIADKSACVPAGRLTSALSYFLEGKEAISHQKYKDHLIKYSDEQAKYWINFFKDANMKQLYEAGTGVVATGWYIIRSAIRDRLIEAKWRAVYSQSTDPLVWDKLANDNPHVMNGRPTPFGLTLIDLNDMQSKVHAFLQNPIEPRTEQY